MNKIVLSLSSALKSYDVFIVTQTSGLQWEGIFIPTAENILLQNVPNTIISGGIKLYSLQFFTEQCISQNKHVLDLLCKDEKYLLYCSDSCLRHWFISRNFLMFDKRAGEIFIIEYYKYIISLATKRLSKLS